MFKRNKPFTRSSVLTFGKHKGSSIQRIHCGINQVPLEDSSMVARYYLARHIRDNNIPNHEIPNLKSFAIDVISTKDASITQGLIGNDTAEYIKTILQINGNPDYIIWCINNVQEFCIEESELKRLEEQEVYSLKSVYIESIEPSNESFDNFDLSFDLNFNSTFFKYSDNIHKLNREKINLFY